LKGRLNFENKVGAHGERQKHTLKAVEKLRKDKEEAEKERSDKLENRKFQQDLEKAQEVIQEEIMTNIVKPFERITGLEKCREMHNEPDEEEEVTDSDDDTPVPPKARQQRKGVLKH